MKGLSGPDVTPMNAWSQQPPDESSESFSYFLSKYPLIYKFTSLEFLPYVTAT